MHRFGFTLFFSLALVVCARADTIHVDDDAHDDPGPGNSAVSDPLEDGTAAHPFDRIQEAIAVAADRAIVLVHTGTYRETIDLLGTCITLTGFDPGAAGAAAWPVIDGGGAGPAVSFTRGEDANCVLSGFVITGGWGRSAGAILCSDSSPTVLNCLIAGNRASESSGAAVHCVNSDAVFINCTICDNYTGQEGAGLRTAGGGVTVANTILWNNAPKEILADGVLPAVRYSVVKGGWPGPGCINTDPRFAGKGGWAASARPGARAEPDDPDAVWMMGDYHLQSQAGRYDPATRRWVVDSMTSPCVDAGDSSWPVGWEPPPNGDIINLGAYGGTAEAARSPCDTPVHFPDANLRAAVEDELWMADPTPLDMLLALPRLISPGTYTYTNAIRDLTGIEYAGNLDEINVRYHRISDISALSGTKALHTAILLGNRIKDISPLAGMSDLRELDLEQNEVVDISVLSGLHNLESVGLHRNYIRDISPLANLTRLRWLDLRANPLNETAYDVYLPRIAANNPGITLLYDPLFHGRLVVSSTAGGSVVSPGEGEFTYPFYATVVLEAVADPGFEFVGWSGDYSTSDNPATLVMDQDYRVQAVFTSL